MYFDLLHKMDFFIAAQLAQVAWPIWFKHFIQKNRIGHGIQHDSALSRLGSFE